MAVVVVDDKVLLKESSPRERENGCMVRILAFLASLFVFLTCMGLILELTVCGGVRSFEDHEGRRRRHRRRLGEASDGVDLLLLVATYRFSTNSPKGGTHH